ncbi:MAG TPA: TerC/Alx family metal homeostasis membrane protein [Candidatus Dormibacteraeota bacterium]|nr:TerC/Alx family metal homeostasis membrane protein [Candidatus Dormibacteraeota bacterium]
MGTWTLWIAFNAGVAVFLLLDLGLFHRRAHRIALREALFESIAWVTLSIAFGVWIFFSHGRGPGLEFFTGYVIEKSLSLDNVFVFLLIFQYFRVDPRYQHRLLFWGVLGALVLRGAMIGLGTVLIQRYEWILYVFGVFLVYAGFRLFRTHHSIHPEKNPIVRWAQKFLPMSQVETRQELFVWQNGRLLITPLFLVVLVLETTDLVFALDSIPAVFGVTHDPFLVYSSNVCAILGLRAFYFLLAGLLPYFRYLNDGLAVVLMFIGGKMLAEPWVHIPTGVSLAVVGSVIAVAALASILYARPREQSIKKTAMPGQLRAISKPTPESIGQLGGGDPAQRLQVARNLFASGMERTHGWLEDWENDFRLHALIVREQFPDQGGGNSSAPKLTVGIAVQPETFARIRAANGAPALADAPSDQDVIEYELEFAKDGISCARLDILTTKEPGGNGAIARFLEKFGEAIQQLEIDVTDVDRATDILRTEFKLDPIYPATRPGANGTRVNFFLVTNRNNKKVLVELVEQPKAVSGTDSE